MRIINNNLIIMVYPCPKRQRSNLLKKIKMRKINNLRDYFLIFFVFICSLDATVMYQDHRAFSKSNFNIRGSKLFQVFTFLLTFQHLVENFSIPKQINKNVLIVARRGSMFRPQLT